MEGLFGFLGVIIGVLITIIFQRKSDVYGTKLRVYSDFLDAVSSQAVYGILDSRAKMTSNKVKIIVIGSNEVITELTTFFSGRAVLDNDESINRFNRVIEAMRKDLKMNRKPKQNEIETLLYGKEEVLGTKGIKGKNK